MRKKNTAAPNSDVKCRFVLDCAYQGTYLEAIANKRSKIFLTLVGGGAFGNKKEWIYSALLAAHKKWGIIGQSSLQKVTLVVFKSSEITNSFISTLLQEGIPHKIIQHA